jgi:hypothetical protein
MGITITEALAEIKTIGKRVSAKRDFVNGLLYRQDAVRDPNEKDGGSIAVVARERQGIADLEERVVVLRRAIQRANETTDVTVNGKTRSIADWLVWRRDVAPGCKQHLLHMRQNLLNLRNQLRPQGANVVAPGEAKQFNDFVVNVNEAELAVEIENLEDILGQLDGQLSLKNATITLEG